MSHIGNEKWEEARQDWLSKYEREEKDVMSDEQGEYIMVEKQGDPEDGEEGFDKVYLPNTLQEQ